MTDEQKHTAAVLGRLIFEQCQLRAVPDLLIAARYAELPKADQQLNAVGFALNEATKNPDTAFAFLRAVYAEFDLQCEIM